MPLLIAHMLQPLPFWHPQPDCVSEIGVCVDAATVGCVEEQWGKQTPRGSTGKSENPESNKAATGRTISSIYHSWTISRVHFNVFVHWLFICLWVSNFRLDVFQFSSLLLAIMTILALEIHHLLTLIAFSNAIQQSTVHAVVCKDCHFIQMELITEEIKHLKHVAALITKKKQLLFCQWRVFFRTSSCDKTVSAVLHEHCNL